MTWFILVPIAIGLGLTGLAAFFWTLRHDQYDDLEGDALRILVAPDIPIPQKECPNGQLAAHADYANPDRGL